MFYQLYNIHLLNGEVIQSAEDYDLPAEKGLVGMFERMKETDILTVNDLLWVQRIFQAQHRLYRNRRCGGGTQVWK